MGNAVEQGCQMYGPWARSGWWNHSICLAGLLAGHWKLWGGAPKGRGLPQNLVPLSPAGHGDWQQQGEQGLTQPQLPSLTSTISTAMGPSPQPPAPLLPHAEACTTMCPVPELETPL